MKLPMLFRALSSLEDLQHHGDLILENGMASVDWKRFEEDLHEASTVINEIDDHVMFFVDEMNNLRHALSMLVAQQDIWPLIYRDTRDALSSAHQTLHKSPLLNAQGEQ